MARPSIYTEALTDELCERLSGGESVLSICRDDHMPPQSVVYKWLSKFPAFAEKYARARQFWAESEFERMLEIADTTLEGVKTKDGPRGVEVITGDMIEHRRLQVETRKWALARMAPHKYGDRSDVNLRTPEGMQVTIRNTIDPAPGKPDQ